MYASVHAGRGDVGVAEGNLEDSRCRRSPVAGQSGDLDLRRD